MIKPIETYWCQDCNYQWGTDYASFETPSCPSCGEHLSVIETTDTLRELERK